jgi:hypothetical protein
MEPQQGQRQWVCTVRDGMRHHVHRIINIFQGLARCSRQAALPEESLIQQGPGGRVAGRQQVCSASCPGTAWHQGLRLLPCWQPLRGPGPEPQARRPVHHATLKGVGGELW